MIVTCIAILSMVCHQDKPAVLEAKSVIDLVSGLRALSDEPIFIASVINDHHFSEEVSPELLQESTFADYLKLHWNERFDEKWQNLYRESPIDSVPHKEAWIARPRYVTLTHGKNLLHPQPNRIFGKWINPTHLPATPLADFTFSEGKVTLKPNVIARMKAENFQQVKGERPIKMHWFIGSQWVAMSFDALTREQFLEYLAISTGGKLVKNDDHDYIDLDIKYARDVWKQTYTSNSIPEMKMVTSEYIDILRERIIVKFKILDEYSDFDLAECLAKMGGSKTQYPSANAPIVTQMKEQVMRWLDSEPRKHIGLSTDPQAQKASINFESAWRHQISFPSISTLVPLKSDPNGFWVF